MYSIIKYLHLQWCFYWHATLCPTFTEIQSSVQEWRCCETELWGSGNHQRLHTQWVNVADLWVESAHTLTLTLTTHQMATYGSLFTGKWPEAALTSPGKQPEPVGRVVGGQRARCHTQPRGRCVPVGSVEAPVVSFNQWTTWNIEHRAYDYNIIFLFGI